MSKNVFSSTRKSPIIEVGDTVIAYLGRDSLTPVTVTPGQVLVNKFGRFPHDGMIGKPWGSVLRSTPRPNDGFIHLLRPTPQLWTESLTHRTQILYLPDISFITAYLDIKPGSRVIEAGTGSGSFSHALANVIGEKGKLHTFEFHHERYQAAMKEFERHGLNQILLEHRNVCKDGFGIIEQVTAVFLDLPSPWDAIPAAREAFRVRHDVLGRICCFSPCIEQVLKTVTTLSDNGFSDIVTYEVSLRDHLLSTQDLPDIQTAFDRLWDVQKKKETRREWQIEQTRIEKEKKRKREEEAEAEEDEVKKKRVVHKGETVDITNSAINADTEKNGSETTERPFAAKKVKTEESSMTIKAEEASLEDVKQKETVQSRATPTNGNGKKPLKKEATDFVYRAQGFLKGHTSFLTFAFLRPSLTAALKKIEGEDINDESWEVEAKKEGMKTMRPDGEDVEMAGTTLQTDATL
ncbi:tRNA methyltransferase complex GCD14 subunit [Atractiella rhizophila]|nr:tRNA methyltransferase complex GCD14 subunit [Atractiella rhizophila]